MLLVFSKFFSVGALATACQYCLLITFVELLQADKVLASATSYVISAVLNYTLNYYFTFKSDQHHLHSALKFTLVAAVGAAINTILFAALVYQLEVNYIVAQLISTLVVMLWNFTLSAKWTFK